MNATDQEGMSDITIRTKTVVYECGCKVVLGKWREVEAPLTCSKHSKGIVSIVEKTEFMKLDSSILIGSIGRGIQTDIYPYNEIFEIQVGT